MIIKDKKNRLADPAFRNRLICAFLMALLPIVLCVIRTLVNGESLFNVWFCGSNWQDELFYYQLTSGVVHNGIPQGYFGYNEGCAPYLTFGTWSPVLLIFWSIFGRIFGWGLLSPIFCNMLLMSIALFVFTWMVKPGKVNLIVLAVLLTAVTPVSRFIMSCMPEIPAVFTLIIMLACWYSCFEEYRRYKMVTAYIFFFIGVLMRPYLALFIIIPAIIEFKRKKLSILIPGGVFAGSLFVYAVITKLFSSPYFSNEVGTGFITLFFTDGFSAGFNYIRKMLVGAGGYALSLFWPGLRYGKGGDAYYGVSFFLIIVFVGLAIWDLVKKKKEALFSVSFAVIYIGMIFAIILMYKIGVGSRHLMCFIVAACFVLAMRVPDKINISVSAVVLLVLAWVFVYKATDGYYYHVSYKAEGAEYVEDIRNQLAGEMELAKGVSWDNTVIWVSVDYVPETDEYRETVWRMLYAIPDSFALNICTAEYMHDNADNLKCGYVATVPGGTVAGELLEKGLVREIASNEFFVLYKMNK